MNKFPYGNQSFCAALCLKWLTASHWIFSKFPYSNLGCSAAPVWGDVSIQLPVPKAPLLAKRGANQRFALSTLFAILRLQLLPPPLKLGDRPRLLEHPAQSVPFGLIEVDTYSVWPKPNRDVCPLLLE